MKPCRLSHQRLFRRLRGRRVDTVPVESATLYRGVCHENRETQVKAQAKQQQSETPSSGEANGSPSGIHPHGDIEATPHNIDDKVFLKELARLQIELVKLQEWVKHEGLKVVVLFEGRDAAGKGESSNGSPRA